MEKMTVNQYRNCLHNSLLKDSLRDVIKANNLRNSCCVVNNQQYVVFRIILVLGCLGLAWWSWSFPEYYSILNWSCQGCWQGYSRAQWVNICNIFDSFSL